MFFRTMVGSAWDGWHDPLNATCAEPQISMQASAVAARPVREGQQVFGETATGSIQARMLHYRYQRASCQAGASFFQYVKCRQRFRAARDSEHRKR
jgi:hypothetical protein